ncbi:glycosyltransferase [Arthrobacter sp. Soil764]|uniref:glycosyltransferase n=1 Tax=Arthrobacter sp. Soil764 TaxID=1736403 RepID=UPI001F1F8049|nr:glycosyltransferase [Arthrobacter sp. Soil764]
MRGASTDAQLPNVHDDYKTVLTVPPLRHPKRWWVNSIRHYGTVVKNEATIVWNPMMGLRGEIKEHQGPLHVDLLDNWLEHEAFRTFRNEVATSYANLFRYATSVTANSESTLRLALDHGRDDAVLVPNGCDPDKFSSNSTASGRPTVGYIGKIGRRLDVSLIRSTAESNPNWKFAFAGPVLDREVGIALKRLQNIVMLGDVHYSNIPALLQTFDVGWVPHGVSKGQVGGDAIKIYEYRAAGLPVITTPIIGTRERPMPGVTVADANAHGKLIRSLDLHNGRVPRMPYSTPPELTWKAKTEKILALMEVHPSVS